MILVRRDGAWVNANLQMFGDEPELQSLLGHDPHLVPGCAGAVLVQELLIPRVGRVDLLAVDDSGTLTLIECKLAKNPEIRRSVVGQILAYASGLAGTTFEQFDALFADRNGGVGVLDAVAAKVDHDIDRQGLRRAVERSLDEGRFRLVVAVDAITDELRAIIEFLNEHLNDSVSVLALEVGYFKDGSVELLVPATYGAEIAAAKEVRSSTTRRWSEHALEDAVADIPEAGERAFVQKLLEHAKANGATVKGGVGGAPSAGFYYIVGDQRRSVWSLYVRPEGAVVSLNLGSIAAALPSRAETIIAMLEGFECVRSKLGADRPMWNSKFPEVAVAALLAEPGAAPAFLSALDTAQGTETHSMKTAVV